MYVLFSSTVSQFLWWKFPVPSVQGWCLFPALRHRSIAFPIPLYAELIKSAAPFFSEASVSRLSPYPLCFSHTLRSWVVKQQEAPPWRCFVLTLMCTSVPTLVWMIVIFNFAGNQLDIPLLSLMPVVLVNEWFGHQDVHTLNSCYRIYDCEMIQTTKHSANIHMWFVFHSIRWKGVGREFSAVFNIPV